jgi:hypothetical protein
MLHGVLDIPRQEPLSLPADHEENGVILQPELHVGDNNMIYHSENYH